MKTWEYKIINVRSENYSMDPRRAEELNRLGDDGWELVSISNNNVAYMKRQHPEPAPVPTTRRRAPAARTQEA